MVRINKEEYWVLNGLDYGWEWIAEDKDTTLWVYEEKPRKKAGCWDEFSSDCKIVDSNLFQFIQWGDEEPHNIKELIEEYERGSEETEVKKDKEWAQKEVDRYLYYEGVEAARSALAFAKGVINQLDEPEVTEEQVYEKIAETFPATAKEIESVLEKYYSGILIEFSEELQESIMGAFDVETTSKTIEALTGMTLEQIAEEAINGGIVPKQEEVGQHKELLDELNDLYARKNQDYGNSFDESLDEDGLLVLKIRLGDKYKRFSTLINQKNEVVDESMRDTLIDLANYALMGVMWMDKNEEEE